MTVAAIWTAASKLRLSLSYRVAMRRQSLSLPMARSMALRRRYLRASKGCGFFRVGLLGMTGSVPRAISRSRRALLS